jgi:hypothetical protein
MVPSVTIFIASSINNSLQRVTTTVNARDLRRSRGRSNTEAMASNSTWHKGMSASCVIMRRQWQALWLTDRRSSSPPVNSGSRSKSYPEKAKVQNGLESLNPALQVLQTGKWNRRQHDSLSPCEAEKG